MPHIARVLCCLTPIFLAVSPEEEAPQGDSCELLQLLALNVSEVVVVNKTAKGPYCYEVPNVSYAEDVIIKDPLASLGGEASMYFGTTCANVGYPNYLGYDPVFTSAELYTWYPAAETWQQALADWHGICEPFGGPFTSPQDPINYWWPVPDALQFVPCTSRFALCYFAKCKDNGDGTASCGCYEGEGANLVAVNDVWKACPKLETISACPEGVASCTKPNEAPFCEYMKHPKKIYPRADLISDFFYTAHGSPDYSGTYPCTDPGRYANCMTAPCKREPFELDETTYNVTCTCPIRVGKYGIAATTPQGSCELPENLLWSAAPQM